jgi:hypothetical protein
MYFADHPPPHFHVVTRDDERAAVSIETLAILAGEPDPREMAEAIQWARANRKELRERWKAYSEEESPKRTSSAAKPSKGKP